jgi:VWFA-related protein
MFYLAGFFDKARRGLGIQSVPFSIEPPPARLVGEVRTMPKRALVLCLLSCFVSVLLQAQTSSSNQETPTIRTTTREVVLDVVVRDKHHHPVTDLRPEEVQVFEDGVRQKINAFRDVQGSEQLQNELTQAKDISSNAVAKNPASATSSQLKQINFVSVVFAQIAPLNLEFAREAVQDFLKSDTFPNTYITVYRLDGGLKMVQSYTSDKLLLTKAVDAVTKGLRLNNGGLGLNATVVSGANATIQAAAANIIANPLTSPAVSQAVANMALNPMPLVAQDPLWARNAAAQDVSITLGNALLTQAHLASGLRFAESLSNGMDSLDAMRRLIQSEERLPGRKVVLYLADGLTLPMDRRDAVDGLISFANRAGVVFYTLDTRGLSVEDPVSHPLSTMEQAAAASSVNNVNPRLGHMEDDDIGLAVTSNTQLSLEEIAESTGGFAVSNTNQIAEPMQRMMEDIRTHYELAYTPTSTKYDGHFRTIEVKISRPHLMKPQTRKGYFALPDINGEPLQPFEMAALKAINERPAPSAFPYDTALIKFRPGSEAVTYEMAFDIPITGLRVVMNHKTGRSQIRASLVALIHKADGEVVGKISRNLVREVNKAELQHLANQHILYAEPMALAGGHYLVDTAVTDEQSEKTTVKHLSIFVDSGKEFGVSSLQLVRSVSPQSGPRNPLDPFQTDAIRILPTLSQSAPSDKPLDLYFVVYPHLNATPADAKITLQMFQNGKEIARKTVGLPQPQDDGAVPMLMRLNPSPGQCDVVVTAQEGTLAAQSTLSVKIDPAMAGNAN